MIGHDIAANLDGLRAQWLSLMVDAATVDRLDPTTPDTWRPVWSGSVRVQRGDPSPSTAPPGSLGFSLAALQIQAPVDGTDGIRVGDRITVAGHPPAYVVDTVTKTHMARRRIAAQHVVGGFTVTVTPRRTTDRLGDSVGRAPYTVPDCVIYGQSSTDPVDTSQVTSTRLAILAPPATPLRNGDELSADGWLIGRYVIDGDPATGPLGVTAPLTKAPRK